jgi:membrane complex biogenesis BtpA family protein
LNGHEARESETAVTLEFLREKALIGMVHVGALPGSPRARASVRELAEEAAREAKLLADAGFDAVVLENMHDVPFLRRDVGPEIVAAMTAVACAVRAAVTCPIGVQILAGANREALAVALASGLQFIRAEGFVFGHVADEGWMESDAGALLRHRRAIGAERIAVFADIKKKHAAHAVTADVGLAETAEAAAFFGADGVIVTGPATGRPAAAEDVAAVRRATRLPVLVGSGVTPENLASLWPHADGFIVGSSLKRDGRWDMPLDAERLARMVNAACTLRGRPPGKARQGARRQAERRGAR